jgi:hypothetical protein
VRLNSNWFVSHRLHTSLPINNDYSALCVCVFMCVCMYVYICVYVYIYIYVYIKLVDINMCFLRWLFIDGQLPSVRVPVYTLRKERLPDETELT